MARRSLSVSGELYDELKVHCVANDDSMSNVAETLLRKFLGMEPRIKAIPKSKKPLPAPILEPEVVAEPTLEPLHEPESDFGKIEVVEEVLVAEKIEEVELELVEEEEDDERDIVDDEDKPRIPRGLPEVRKWSPVSEKPSEPLFASDELPDKDRSVQVIKTSVVVPLRPKAVNKPPTKRDRLEDIKRQVRGGGVFTF